MKAPDKIYIQQTGEVTFNALWKDKPFDKGFNFIYIRKDALLEWAKEQKSFEQGFEDGMEERGYRFALDDLIDKLNSL